MAQANLFVRAVAGGGASGVFVAQHDPQELHFDDESETRFLPHFSSLTLRESRQSSRLVQPPPPLQPPSTNLAIVVAWISDLIFQPEPQSEFRPPYYPLSERMSDVVMAKLQFPYGPICRAMQHDFETDDMSQSWNFVDASSDGDTLLSLEAETVESVVF